MSQQQLETTQLLCTLLEMGNESLSGPMFWDSRRRPCVRSLRHEHLLSVGAPLQRFVCPVCGVSFARWVKDLPDERVLVLCDDECGAVDAPASTCQTFHLNSRRLMTYLANGLELDARSVREIKDNAVWHIGLSQHGRKRTRSWYFARRVHDADVAQSLADQIRADSAQASATILTSTSARPAPILADRGVLNLANAGWLSSGQFVFHDDIHATGATSVEQTVSQEEPCGTTLRYVRTKGIAYVNGVSYRLEKTQRAILIALIDAFAHRMSGDDIGSTCASNSFPFQPSKYFGRNKLVYQTFVRWVQFEAQYELCVPPEDADWL